MVPDGRWRPVPPYRLLGIPAGYEASSLGGIRSVPRTLAGGRRAGGVVLAQQHDRDGYATVKLGRKRYRVNVLVQLAFAGPPEVRHLDGDRSDNRPMKLAWGSRVENEEDKKEGKEGDGRGAWERPFRPRTPGTEGAS